MTASIEPLHVQPQSLARRLLGSGIGAVLALGYWSMVAVCLAATALFTVLTMPGFMVAGVVVTAFAWGFGLFLCVIAALLTISPQMRRAAVAFLLGSAAANVVLAAAVLLVVAAVAVFT